MEDRQDLRDRTGRFNVLCPFSAMALASHLKEN